MTWYTGRAASLISLYSSVLKEGNTIASDVNSYLLCKIYHLETFFLHTVKQNSRGYSKKPSLNLKWQITRRKKETSEVE